MPNPLTEPNPNSMDEEMRRLDATISGDPRTLTRPQRDAFVAYLRGLRTQWARDEAAGAKRAKAPKLEQGGGIPISVKDVFGS